MSEEVPKRWLPSTVIKRGLLHHLYLTFPLKLHLWRIFHAMFDYRRVSWFIGWLSLTSLMGETQLRTGNPWKDLKIIGTSPRIQWSLPCAPYCLSSLCRGSPTEAVGGSDRSLLQDKVHSVQAKLMVLGDCPWHVRHEEFDLEHLGTEGLISSPHWFPFE